MGAYATATFDRDLFKFPSVCFEYGLLTGIVLPAHHNHVDSSLHQTIIGMLLLGKPVIKSSSPQLALSV